MLLGSTDHMEIPVIDRYSGQQFQLGSQLTARITTRYVSNQVFKMISEPRLLVVPEASHLVEQG